ncbi:unnamed protein product [Orchesella dallaii]|uniref:Uncharacterized protein n=1 Tax=Orchesella dallaii TaxID=48710 RepID=A0ABP1QAQ8_9HEXA
MSVETLEQRLSSYALLRKKAASLRCKSLNFTFSSFEQLEDTLNKHDNVLSLGDDLVMFYCIRDAQLKVQDLSNGLEIQVCYDVACDFYVSMRKCVGGTGHKSSPLLNKVQASRSANNADESTVLPSTSYSSYIPQPAATAITRGNNQLSNHPGFKKIHNFAVPLQPVFWHDRRKPKGGGFRDALMEILISLIPNFQYSLPDRNIISSQWERLLDHIREQNKHSRNFSMKYELREKAYRLRRQILGFTFRTFKELEVALNMNGNVLYIGNQLVMFFCYEDAMLKIRDMSTKLEISVCYDVECDSYVHMRQCVGHFDSTKNLLTTINATECPSYYCSSNIQLLTESDSEPSSPTTQQGEPFFLHHDFYVISVSPIWSQPISNHCK